MSQRIQQKPKRRRPDFQQDPCQDVFTCRVCGWPVGPQAAGTMDLTQEMADAIFTPAES